MSDFLGAFSRYNFRAGAQDISPPRRYSSVTSSEAIPAPKRQSGVETPKPSEDEILVGLPAYRRWEFIARNHPVEFWGVLFAGVLAAYVLVRTIWDVFPAVTSMLIQMAHAEGKPDTVLSFGTIGISAQTFVALILAVVLFWFMSIISKTTIAANATFARDAIKTLIGFFVGLGTGAVSSK